jgi:hypothetical protein
MPADSPGPADLRNRLRQQLAGAQEPMDYLRRRRNARATLAAHPELKQWRYVGTPQRAQRGQGGADG